MKKNAQSKARAAEWFTALFCVWDGWSWVRALKLYQMLVDTCANMWIEKARPPCWHLYGQQVSYQRWIRGSLKWESTQGIHPFLETQGRCHQKSKQGYQWPHEKDLCPPKTSRILLVLQLLLPFANSHLTTAFTAQIWRFPSKLGLIFIVLEN